MASDAVMSLGIHPYGKQMCVFALCRDLKLRIWSCQVLAINLCMFHSNVTGNRSLKIMLVSCISSALDSINVKLALT